MGDPLFSCDTLVLVFILVFVVQGKLTYICDIKLLVVKSVHLQTIPDHMQEGIRVPAPIDGEDEEIQHHEHLTKGGVVEEALAEADDGGAAVVASLFFRVFPRTGKDIMPVDIGHQKRRKQNGEGKSPEWKDKI
jgi:hypothetical protein